MKIRPGLEEIWVDINEIEPEHEEIKPDLDEILTDRAKSYW